MRKWDLQALMTDVFICECGATLTTRITAQRRLYSSQICLIGFSSIMLLHCTVPWAAVEDGEVRGGGEALSSWVIWLFPWGVCGIHFTRSNLGDQLRLGVWYSVADLRQYGLYMCKKWSKRWEWGKKNSSAAEEVSRSEKAVSTSKINKIGTRSWNWVWMGLRWKEDGLEMYWTLRLSCQEGEEKTQQNNHRGSEEEQKVRHRNSRRSTRRD